MVTRKPVKMWVDPDFKKVIKKSAIDKDMSIIDYTSFLACNGEIKDENKKEKKLKFFF